jgi:hypothetical protein
MVAVGRAYKIRCYPSLPSLCWMSHAGPDPLTNGQWQCSGAVARWRGGAVARWRGGAVVPIRILVIRIPQLDKDSSAICCAQQTGVHEMVVEALLNTIYLSI